MTTKPHVMMLPAPAVAALRRRLADAGFAIGDAPHAHFAAAGERVRVVAYRSGKLVAQGAGVAAFLDRFADALTPSADGGAAGASTLAAVRGPTIGSDESGKGDYFGSLVVAACRLTPADLPLIARLGVRDSKTAGDAEIRAAATELVKQVAVAVVELEPEEYNRTHLEVGNVNIILGRAHARAIRELLQRGPCERIVVDRFSTEPWVERNLGGAAVGIELIQVPRAEENPAVAAASFVARARFLASLDRGSIRAGTRLLPGASAAVEACGRRVFASGGHEVLARVAKLHFKTTERVTSRA